MSRSARSMRRIWNRSPPKRARRQPLSSPRRPASRARRRAASRSGRASRKRPSAASRSPRRMRSFTMFRETGSGTSALASRTGSDGGWVFSAVSAELTFSQSPARDATWPSNHHRDVSQPPTAGDVRTRPYSIGWYKRTSRPICAGATKATGMAVRCRPTSNGSSAVPPVRNFGPWLRKGALRGMRP